MNLLVGQLWPKISISTDRPRVSTVLSDTAAGRENGSQSFPTGTTSEPKVDNLTIAGSAESFRP